MKVVFLFEPSIGSDNIGDDIIVNSVKKQINDILKNNFCIEFPTHLPLSNRYFFFLKKPFLSFVCGSNILMPSFFYFIHNKQWKINLLNLPFIKGCVFLGVGAQGYTRKYNFFTRLIYKYLFSNNYINSVRDSYTEKLLKESGIDNVINTACPTMWALTPTHCRIIPTQKADNVIFTLTDYSQNRSRDNNLIEILNKNYSKVYFWPQGCRDLKYFYTLDNIHDISIIPPSLYEYEKFLQTTNVDFVGTRLHGGIFALQNKKRTIIIAIDNRAKELHKDFNIPVIYEEDLVDLDTMINSTIVTDIHLPVENIKKFLSQFNITYDEQ